MLRADFGKSGGEALKRFRIKTCRFVHPLRFRIQKLAEEFHRDLSIIRVDGSGT